jgi:quercetin dioxygenase-like cupin family protein
MDAAQFEADLKRAGYSDIETKRVGSSESTHPHAHPFHVRALVLAGELTLTSQGASRTFRAGDAFEMAAGCVHSEQHGPEGTTYLVGRKT